MARKRYLRIILLPFLAPIFLLGWMLAYKGEKVAPKKLVAQTVKAVNQADLEMGVLAEEVEELRHGTNPPKRRNSS